MSQEPGRGARDERGSVVILMAFMMVTLLVMAAFAVDLGNARQVRRQAQSAADVAVLAGAAELSGKSDPVELGRAVSQVKLYVARNLAVAPAAWSGCDAAATVPAGWTAPDTANNNRCILVDDSLTQVRLTRIPTEPLETFFGKVVGIDTLSVSAGAAAVTYPGGTSPCGFCILGDFDAQNGDFAVSGDAGASIGGDASAAPNGGLTVTGTNAEIRIYDQGRVTRPENFSPTPISVPGTLPDPLAGLAVPSTSGPFRSPCLGPGVYMTIPAGCPLSPGLYVITGGTHLSGGVAVDATSGVTLYLTCAGPGGSPRPCGSGGEQGAELICTGQATLDVRAQPRGGTAIGGAIPGMAVFFDRNNTGALDCRGKGTSPIFGTIYGARAELRMRGNGACTLTDSLVVVGSVTFSGNPASCEVTYREPDNVEIRGAVALLE
jgi:Flp pilus assembly protein TadG